MQNYSQQHAYQDPGHLMVFQNLLEHRFGEKGELIIYFNDFYLGDPAQGLDLLLGDYVSKLLKEATNELTTLANRYKPHHFFEFELEDHPWKDEGENEIYRFDTQSFQVKPVYDKKEVTGSSTENGKEPQPEDIKDTLPPRAHTINEFALMLLNYLNPEKGQEVLSFEELRQVIISFKKGLGQFLGIAEEGKSEQKEEGIWDFLASLEKQRNPNIAQPFDNRKTNPVLKGILDGLQILLSNEEVKKHKLFGQKINRLIDYIVHYQNREGDPFVAAHNIIDRIVAGEIDRVNRVNLVKTLGDIRFAMSQYLKGELEVPLLQMLDKKTKKAHENKEGKKDLQKAAAQDHRKTSAFLNKLKNGLATIQAVYQSNQPFVAQMAGGIIKQIEKFQTRSLKPPKKVKEQVEVDYVTTKNVSKDHYATYQVIYELTTEHLYLFRLPESEKDEKLQQIIEQIRKKHVYQSILDKPHKITFDYDDRQDILRRFNEWCLRKEGKGLEKKLFKSREDAFKAAKAEAKKMLSDEDDQTMWEVNDKLTALYQQGVVELIKRNALSIEKLFAKNDWKKLFQTHGLYALLQKITLYEGIIYGARGADYKPMYDYVNGERISPPKASGGGGEGGAPPKNYQAQLKDMVIDYYVRYRYTLQRLSSANNALAEVQFKNRDRSYRYGNRIDESKQHEGKSQAQGLVTEARKTFRSVARTYFLNEDFGASERAGFWQSFVEGLAEGTFWHNYQTNTDFAQAMAQAMQYEGLPLNAEQTKRIKQSIAEQVGGGLGGSIPVMLKIVATTLITEGIGTLPAIAAAGNTLVRVFSISSKVAKVLRSALVSTIAFQLAGQNKYSGLGEGIIQGLIGGKLPLLSLMKNSATKIVITNFINASIRYGAHVVTEAAQEYGGDFMQNLAKYGSFKKVFKKTFGANLDEAGEKLLVTVLICAAFGKATAIKGFVASTRQGLEAKHAEAKSKEAKQAYLKGLAILSTVQELAPENTQKHGMSTVTPLQIQQAPKAPTEVSKDEVLTALHRKLKAQKQHQNSLEDALGELKGQVGLQVEYGNPNIKGKTVQVHYTPKVLNFGFFKITSIDTVNVRVGPDATVQSIKEHLATINYMRQYQGFSGRMKAFGDRFKKAVGWHGKPAIGTALWEAKKEVEKLSAILIRRANAIERGRFDVRKAAELEAELMQLALQLTYFEVVANSVSKTSKGVGYVAAEQKSDFEKWLQKERAALEKRGVTSESLKKSSENKGESAFDKFRKEAISHLNDISGKSSKNTGVPTVNDLSQYRFKENVSKAEGIATSSKIISHTMKKFPAFSYTADGCYARAAVVADMLMTQGIRTKNIYAVSTDSEGHGELQTDSVFINGVGKKESVWHYHVAAMFEVTENGKTTQYVVDPPLSTRMFDGKPIPLDQWLKAISKKPLTKLHNAMDAFKKDKKKIALGQSEFVKDISGDLQPNTQIYFETEVNIRFENLVSKNKPVSFQVVLDSGAKKLKGEFVKKTKLADLATQVQGIGVNNLPQAKIDAIKNGYTVEEVALTMTKYTGSLRGLAAKIYPKEMAQLVQLSADMNKVLNILDATTLTTTEYESWVGQLKQMGARKFKTNFPFIFGSLQQQAKRIDRDLEKDLLIK